MLNRLYNTVTPANVLRACNVLALGLVLKNYFENPGADVGEYLGGASIYLIQAIFDPNAPCSVLGLASVVGNTWRIYEIGGHLLAGNSTVSTATNLMGLASNGINLAYMGTFFSSNKKELTPSQGVLDNDDLSVKKKL